MEDWDDYRFFIAVVRNGSLSAAARELRVSQPTVARHVSQLERRLDARLFEQMPSGMQVTKAGRTIADRAELIEKAIADLGSHILERESDVRGEIKITATSTFTSAWLASRVKEFTSAHPQTRIMCISSDEILNMAKREADVAVRIGRPKSSNMLGSRVGYIHFGLYASHCYLKECGRPMHLDELKKHRLIRTFEPLSRFRQTNKLEGLMEGAASEVKTNCSHSYRSLAVAGHGLASLPCYFAESGCGLERLLSDEFDVRRELWILTHPSLRHSARVRALIDFLRGEIARDQGALTGGWPILSRRSPAVA